MLSDEKVSFVRLGTGSWLSPDQYRWGTMLRQALGSAIVIGEALHKRPCDILIDTMGFGWIYPVAKLLCPQLRVLSYTHYPFISSDMLHKVESHTSDFNNAAAISSSGWRTYLKGLYRISYPRV